MTSKIYSIVEPRLEAIQREVERLLNLVELECKGKVINVDGFRLRDLSSWQTSYAKNSFEALGPLSGTCNAKCVFCMERSLPFERDGSSLSMEEASTRIKYFSPESKMCLFHSARPHMETFINKDAVNILKKARRINPFELLIITTNGSYLTEETIKCLTDIKPLLIKLSVNSTDFETRKNIMGLTRKSNNVGINAMELLKRAEIPFIGSIVAWPNMPYAEIEDSIKKISVYEPYGVRVRLPLVHKYTPCIPEGDLNLFWQKTFQFIDSIKHELNVPIWIEPVQFGRVPFIPIIDGVITNSPAMLSGIKPGDQIVSIDGKNISLRQEIRDIFSSGTLDNAESVKVRVKRNEEFFTFDLRACDPDSYYPYDACLGYPGERLGMFFLPDFDINYLNNILHLAIKHNAEKILLFCSPLTANTLEQVISKVPLYSDFFSKRDLWIYVLEETWMGGNTRMLDSRFVDDYKSAIRKICTQAGDKPDVILIPDNFGSAWGIDFHGRSIFEVQNSTGIPIELIPWHYIYGRED